MGERDTRYFGNINNGWLLKCDRTPGRWPTHNCLFTLLAHWWSCDVMWHLTTLSWTGGPGANVNVMWKCNVEFPLWKLTILVSVCVYWVCKFLYSLTSECGTGFPVYGVLWLGAWGLGLCYVYSFLGPAKTCIRFDWVLGHSGRPL